MKVYAIYDVKANTCQAQLYVMQNDDVAKRAFAAALAQPGPELKLIAQYPDDFFLVCLGEFDQQAQGKVIPNPEDPRVCCIGDLRNQG